jgi:hypothetical protein
MQKIHIKLKQAGKRRLILEKQAIEIESIGKTPDLRTLITAIVTQQVHAYNAKTLEKHIVDFLTPTQIEDAVASGKVGFGSIYNEQKADLTQAIQNAIEAHIDGLFVVAVNDKVVDTLDSLVALEDGAVIMFIRLTLLIGQ